MSVWLQNKGSDPDVGVYLFGTTPPKQGIGEDDVRQIAQKLVARLADFDYDGLVVYDIQDETSRTSVPRPFPFKHTQDPLRYGELLGELSGKPAITYKSVAQRCVASFNQWLAQLQQTGRHRHIVLVGSPSSHGDIRLSLNDAYKVASRYRQQVCLGGVTIAERHAKKLDEHHRLLAKAQQGCEYFISQAVYDAEATIDLLTSYSVLCRQKKVAPKRIILTFSPCGSQKTLAFMQWLGINVPTDAKRRILAADDMLDESVAVCVAHFRHILQSTAHLNLPLGLNIESLTNRKAEIDASVALFKQLKQMLQQHLSRGRATQRYALG